MGKLIKVKLKSKGVREMLRSDEALQICKDHAYAAQSKLGSGYEVTYMKGKNRANAMIECVSYEAMKENMRKNSILKALR